MIADSIAAIILGLASGHMLGSCYWVWLNNHRELVNDRYKYNYVFWASLLAVCVVLYFIYKLVTATVGVRWSY